MGGPRFSRFEVVFVASALALGVVGTTPRGWASTSADSLSARPDSTIATHAARRMADTVTVLKPVLVQGQRGIVPERGSATSVRMDRGRVTRFLPSTTAQALAAAPGLDVVSTGPWASHVGLRGLTGERVLVLVDGVRLQSGRGHGAMTSLVPVDRLEGAEILPGSGSAQYGSDALGGVVELSTHRPLIAHERRTTFTLNARANEPGDGFNQSLRILCAGPRIGGELYGDVTRLHALVTADSAVDRSGYRSGDWAARLGGQLGVATLDLEHTTNVTRDAGLPAFATPAGGRASFPLQGRDVDRFEVSAPGAGRVPAWRLIALQQRFRTHFDEFVADSQFVHGHFVAMHGNESYDRIRTVSRGLLPSITWSGVRVFGEWRREVTEGPRSLDSTTTNAAGVQTYHQSRESTSLPPAWRDILAAGVATSRVVGPVRLDVTAREDWQRSHADSTVNQDAASGTPASDLRDQRWSGDVGVARANGTWLPYARIANSFRAPNLEERYSDGSIVHGQMLVWGARDLRPEAGRTVEAGLRVRDALAGHVVSARVSAYRSDVDDMITFQYASLVNGVSRFVYANVRRARLDGVEGEADLRLGRVQAYLSASAPSGIDLETRKPLNNIGAARALLDVRTPLRVLPLGLASLRVQWTNAVAGDRDELARRAYWTSSAELSTTLVGARVTLAVDNLTNTRYRDPMSFVDGPGRSVALAVRWDRAITAPRWLRRS